MTALRQASATLANGATYKLAFVGLIYLDLVLTVLAVRGGFTEMNPVMAGLLDNAMGLTLLKVVAPLLIIFLVPPKFLLPSIGFMLFVTFWNFSQIASSI